VQKLVRYFKIGVQKRCEELVADGWDSGATDAAKLKEWADDINNVLCAHTSYKDHMKQLSGFTLDGVREFLQVSTHWQATTCTSRIRAPPP
jgi:hypothetical protein